MNLSPNYEDKNGSLRPSSPYSESKSSGIWAKDSSYIRILMTVGSDLLPPETSAASFIPMTPIPEKLGGKENSEFPSRRPILIFKIHLSQSYNDIEDRGSG